MPKNKLIEECKVGERCLYYIRGLMCFSDDDILELYNELGSVAPAIMQRRANAKKREGGDEE